MRQLPRPAAGRAKLKKPVTEDDTVCRCEVDCGASCDNRRAQVECMVSTCPLGQACTNVGGVVSPQSLPKTIVARSEGELDLDVFADKYAGESFEKEALQG